MFNYLRASFRRKKARLITQEYPAKIDTFDLQNFGKVEFANWENPLTTPIKLNPSSVGFFKQFIKEGDLVIDIGANIGAITVPMAICAGRDGLTLGFDPNPYVYKILEVNASLNRDKTNIHPVPFAISANEEKFYFISSEASFCNGGISTTRESKHGKFVYSQKIQGVNLKKFLEEEYEKWLPMFSFIKIDTEGYDKEILKSIADLLISYKPIIIAESFGKSTNEEKMELYEVIEKLGYDVYYFEDFKEGTKIERVDSKTDILKWKNTINIYAIPRK